MNAHECLLFIEPIVKWLGSNVTGQSSQIVTGNLQRLINEVSTSNAKELDNTEPDVFDQNMGILDNSGICIYIYMHIQWIWFEHVDSSRQYPAASATSQKPTRTVGAAPT